MPRPLPRTSPGSRAASLRAQSRCVSGAEEVPVVTVHPTRTDRSALPSLLLAYSYDYGTVAATSRIGLVFGRCLLSVITVSECQRLRTASGRTKHPAIPGPRKRVPLT